MYSRAHEVEFKEGSPDERLRWDLLGAVCLERKPILSQKLVAMQQQYMEFIAQVEFENSMKSDHEVRHEEDLYV